MGRYRDYWLQQIQWWCSRGLEWWIAHLTALYVGGAILIMGSRFDELIKLKLNEVGDLSAGVFGPVAFLWLVLGYVQQGRELKVSSDSLVRQASELGRNVQQQIRIVELQERQLESQANASVRQEMQFRMMVEPNLQLYATSGGFRDGACYRDFSLCNIGADSQKLVVSVNSSAPPRVLRKAQVLRRDGEAKFAYEFGLDGFPCSFNISAKYVNSVGCHGIQSFKVKCSRTENGNVDIDISKYIAS